MSATGNLDDVRQKIAGLARQIEELAQTNAAPQEFFREFLTLLLSATRAVGGAVWMLDSYRQTQLVCELGEAELGLLNDRGEARRNKLLLADVVSNGQSRFLRPDETPDLPSPHVYLLGAVHDHERCVGVVEIWLRPDTPRKSCSGYMQFVEQMCGHASGFLARRQRPEAVRLRSRVSPEFADFVLRLQTAASVREVIAIAANDGRVLLGCDRVSVLRKRGRKLVVEGVSGQEKVNRRANLVRSLTRLANQLIRTGKPFTFAGEASELPVQIESLLADYLSESRSRMLLLVPLVEPRRPGETKSGDDRPRILGGLVCEQFTVIQPRRELLENAQMLAEHVAASLHQARRQEQVLFLSLFRWLGSWREWLFSRPLLKAMCALLLVVALGFALACTPWEYRVAGTGRLMPVEQAEVFAPWDGEVVELFVSGGDRVKAGDRLLRIRNDELHAQRVAASNELQEKRQHQTALEAQLAAAVRAGRHEEELRFQGAIREVAVEIAGLDAQHTILTEREESLTVRSSLAGVVSTFRVEQLLQNRPVHRGESLLIVANDQGRWRLEVEVEEHRVGHLLAAMETAESSQLPVEFLLATAAESTFHGHVTQIATRPQMSTEQGSALEVFASIDDDRFTSPRIGAEVRATIACGKRSLGYVLFGDAIEFVRKRFWL